MKDSRPVEVCCFYWGSWCAPHGVDYINRLYKGVKENLNRSFIFTLFTDNSDIVQGQIDRMIATVSLPVYMNRWSWNLRKMYAYYWFERFTWNSGRVLLLDLDMIITGDITPLVDREEKFITCRGAYRPYPGGSVVSFDSGDKYLMEKLWMPVYEHPDAVSISTGGSERKYFYRQLQSDEITYWQDILPGMVVSYKADLNGDLAKVKDNTSIVRFHGRPRPHEVLEKW